MNRILSGLLAVVASGQATADHILEETVITGRHDARTVELVDVIAVAPDPARLLYKAPGANVVANGPLTGIPQIRGLFGPRIAVTLDDTFLAPAGPNWMDPPISYAATAQLESLKVYRGIAPVSVAQESLGGVIVAQTRRLDFTDSDRWNVDARLQTSAQTVNDGYQLDGNVQAANAHQRVRLAVMHQSGDDAEFPGGTLLPTAYERTRVDLGYGVRWGRHSVQIDYGRIDTGEAGTPALPMDIGYFDGDLIDVTYRFDASDDLAFSATVFSNEIDHGMTNYQMRPAPASPGRWRQNIATTDNAGFRLQGSLNTDGAEWRFGVDGFEASHDSNIDNPNNPMFFVVNFNDARRQVLGAYLEQDFSLGDDLRSEWGVRVNRAETDADEVNGTPAIMMPPAMALRDRFNGSDRDQSDTLVDVFGKLTWQASEHLALYAGMAKKDRAPSYQERYLWLPLEATAGLADGQLYTGNIELNAETAYQFELGFDYLSTEFSLRPRLFYQRIDDYIQGVPTPAGDPALMFVAMSNAMNGTNRAAPLRFENVEAELYGIDLDWEWHLNANWHLGGIVNVVYGERRDISDDLYRIAPPNTSAWLTRRWRDVAVTLEGVVYANQSNVSVTNREQTTPGYGVVNFSANWRVSDGLSLAVGADNLFDREYAPHLGGYNRVMNPDIGMLQRLPAQGRNLFARLSYQF